MIETKGVIVMNAIQIGQNIRLHRMKKGFTQRQLAKLLDITDVAVSYWEIGRNTPTDIQKMRLARILDVSVEELFFKEEFYSLN